MRLGAAWVGNQDWEFTVWAPQRQQVDVELLTSEPRWVPMQPTELGHWQVTITNLPPDTRYRYRLDGQDSFPDPASQFQPEGAHGPSQVVAHHAFEWTDQNWHGIPLAEYIIYELHVGTFTPEGTFDAIADRLADLKELGINAIEIMPVSQFPGDRNWGYDGTYVYAVQNSYGGPEGLKRLVNACHQQGIAVVMDVVYNHFGPEGNYTGQYGPYFTEHYRTPWGSAVNFDDADSPGVRNFVIENALYWLEQYHIDALRLDAVHAIYDYGAYHILAEMADRVAELNQQSQFQRYLIAESDLNDVEIVRSRSQNGHGMDAQWSDDYHHCVHTLLTGENIGYYQDFGTCEQLAKVWRKSFAYTWNYSNDRQRYHGSDPSDCNLFQFVVAVQNHDQVGNRMLGERLSHLVSFEAQKLAAGCLILAPAIPMLFMGEEYGEDAPFLYFISHTDPDLVKAVREGRRREFEAFHLEGEPPDAASLEAFQTSTLNWDKRTQGQHGVLLEFYQTLIQLRRSSPALMNCDRTCLEASADEANRVLALRRWQGNDQTLALFSFNDNPAPIPTEWLAGRNWQKLLDSADSHWKGNGSTLPDTLTSNSHDSLTVSPWSVAVYGGKE